MLRLSCQYLARNTYALCIDLLCSGPMTHRRVILPRSREVNRNLIPKPHIDFFKRKPLRLIQYSQQSNGQCDRAR